MKDADIIVIPAGIPRTCSARPPPPQCVQTAARVLTMAQASLA